MSRRRKRTRMRTNLGEVTKQDFVAIARIFCKRQVSSGAAEDLADLACQNTAARSGGSVPLRKLCACVVW